jgi:hypothetical protein
MGLWCAVPHDGLVDARTGDINYPPITNEGVAVPGFDLPYLTLGLLPQVAELEFRLDSKLMVVKATTKRSSYTYYFLWQGDHWTLLRKIPLEGELQ